MPDTPIHELIELLLKETGYGDYAAAMPAGDRRHANLLMLVEKAIAYENTSYKGLFHFVRYMEQLQKYEVDYGEANLADEQADTVRIMSIHKSKGLEYSAVYFVGLEDSAFWNFRNQPDEDRCTFFVALSRAKESVTFTFCKRRAGMKYPMQQHNAINEFFDLLQKPGIAEVKTVS